MLSDAKIYALRGMKAEAITALKKAFSEGFIEMWPLFLKYDPIFEPLHDELEYQAIVRDVETNMAAQLKHVREMQANGELESIPSW